MEYIGNNYKTNYKDNIEENRGSGFLPVISGIVLAFILTSLIFKPWVKINEYKEHKRENKVYEIDMTKEKIDLKDLGTPIKNR